MSLVTGSIKTGDDFIENLQSQCSIDEHRNLCSVCGRIAYACFSFKSDIVKMYCPKHIREGTFECTSIELNALSTQVNT